MVFVLHSFAFEILVLLPKPIQAWLTILHLTKNMSIDCVGWQLSKDCVPIADFLVPSFFLHTKPMAYHYRNYEPWKGEVTGGGWEVYNNELWNITRWSCGWTDWRTASKPVW